MTRVLPVPLAANSPARLAVLFDTHHNRLYRLARRLAANKDDALDLVQETFLKAARSPKSIPDRATNEEAWLVRVLINIRRDQWRKTSVRERHDSSVRAATHSATAGSLRDPEAAWIASSTVWQALDLLPPRRRAIVVMYELEDLEIPAIASLLGINAITVRWHLSKGRHDLARTLKHSMEDTNENH